MELYDPETDVWTAIEPVYGPGALYSFVKLADGRVLALGVGMSEDGGPASMAAVFDPATSLWSELPGSPFTIRAVPGAFLLSDGRVLVVGGLDFFSYMLESAAEYVKGVEIFDPEAGDWRQAGPTPNTLKPARPRNQPLFLLMADGRVAALGNEETGERMYVPSAEIYDPSTNTWMPIGELDPYFELHEGVALADGRLLVQSETSESAPFRIYDPSNDTWTPTGEPFYSRPLSPVLTLLPDGRVLAAGGEDRKSANEETRAPDGRSRNAVGARLELPHSTTEIYDPRTNTWSLGPDLTELRYGSTATVLLDGMVLLVGGIGVDLESNEMYVLSTSEIVDPNGPPGKVPGTNSP